MPSGQISFHHAPHFDEAVARAAHEERIDHGYWDIFHHYHDVSIDIRRRILAALGWDVSSTEAIDAERERRFRTAYTYVVPATLVVSDAERFAPLTLAAWDRDGDIGYELSLEDGQQLSGTLGVPQLPELRQVHLGNENWVTYRLDLPAEVPHGYHQLRIKRNGSNIGNAHLIVCPDRAYVPDHLTHGGRSAGFNVTLYGLRSDRNWGCGDFTDLKKLIDWASEEVGFSFIGLNPLHALHNRIPYNTSPYLPLSLFYKNLIYIDIEDVPEFRQCAAARNILRSDRIQSQLHNLRASEFVAYHDVARLKRRFLKLLFRQFRHTRTSHPERAHAFDQYCQREGDLLHNFALYSALDEVLHKQDRNRWTWRDWPVGYHDPRSQACVRFAAEHSRLLTYYKYIQFVIEEQLAWAQQHAKAHGMPIGLYHDLALATDSCGSDLWAYRDFYVSGCRVGAPPDDFSPTGQDWAFPPPNADAHLKDGYRLYRESIRKIVRQGGALRIDHVMRLFRLFWIPEGVSAAEGTYVRDRATDLMRILALESERSQNIIIGEDLGTVTDEIRDMLGRFGILSYRLFYFEKHRNGSFKGIGEYPPQALVASSTHDLATMCGFWRGRDIEARRTTGLVDDHGADSQWHDRSREKQAMLDVLHSERLLPDWFSRTASQVPEVDGVLHGAIVAFLSRVPSMLLLLNQEDLTKETEQQNLPGSTAEYPNWQRKMRARLEDLSTDWAPFATMFRHHLHESGRA